MDNTTKALIGTSSLLLLAAIIVIILFATGVIRIPSTTPVVTTTTPVVTTTTPMPTTTPVPYKNLCNQHNKCLASVQNSSVPGISLIQWDKSNENGQLWSLYDSGHICNKHGLCLSAGGGSNGDTQLQNTKQDIDNQKWKFTEAGNLCNKLSNYTKCLASPGNSSTNGIPLIQWDASGEQGQKWSFI